MKLPRNPNPQPHRCEVSGCTAAASWGHHDAVSKTTRWWCFPHFTETPHSAALRERIVRNG
jgi:hypothetical protein